MAIQDTDLLLANRGGTNYQVTASVLMSTVNDTDLFLVNRSGTNYKVTGLDLKDYSKGAIQWEQFSLGATPITGAYLLDNNTGGTFYAVGASPTAMCVICANGSVRRTTNGRTWTNTLTGIAVPPTTGSQASVSVSGNKWVIYTKGPTVPIVYTRYSSTDDGATWTTTTGNSAPPTSGYMFAGGDPYDTTGTFWGVRQNQTGTVTSLIKSTNAGATWTTVPTNLVFNDPRTSVNSCMVTRSAAGQTTLLVVGSSSVPTDTEFWSSTDQGASWSLVHKTSAQISVRNPLYNGGFLTITSASGVTSSVFYDFRNATSNALLPGAWSYIPTQEFGFPSAGMEMWGVGDPSGSAASSAPYNTGYGFGFTWLPIPAPADQPAITQRLGTGISNNTYTGRYFQGRWYYFNSNQVYRQKG